MTDDDFTPTGPQLSDADLTLLSDEDLSSLAALVGVDLKAAEMFEEDGEISREELRWVQSDAERVRNEVIRRES